jgi:hypothetical protein
MFRNVVVEDWRYVDDVSHAAMRDEVQGWRRIEWQIFDGLDERN